jgi:hypothetical protein
MQKLLTGWVFLVFTGLQAQIPVLSQFGSAYQQDFSGFQSAASIPNGWSSTLSTYGGDWGTGSTGGLRGNASVFGFQHTAATGRITQKLEILNGTGQIISALEISYVGKAERLTLVRYPEYEVFVQGNRVIALDYSTQNNNPDTLSAIITGLSIPPGDTIIIEWISERGGGTGASRQIGLTNVSVQAEVFGTLVSTDLKSRMGSRSLISGQNSGLVQISQMELNRNLANIQSVEYPIQGNFTSADISRFILKWSTDANPQNATILDSGSVSGGNLTFNNLNIQPPLNQIAYLFLEARPGASVSGGNRFLLVGTPQIATDSGTVITRNHATDSIYLRNLFTEKFDEEKMRVYIYENEAHIQSDKAMQNFQWQVFDDNGKIIDQGKIPNTTTGGSISISMRLKSSGHYTFVAFNEKQKTSKRFIYISK